MTRPRRIAAPALVRLDAERSAAARFDIAKDIVLHEWEDTSGSVVAYSAEREGRKLFHVEGVGTYLFDAGPGPSEGRSAAVEAAADAGVGTEKVEEAYYRTALPFVLNAQGVQAVHASAVETAGGVLLICGVSGSGKSTLAYGLGTLGFRVFADDVLAFQPVDAEILASPLPFSVRLTSDSASHYFPGRETGGSKLIATIEHAASLEPRRLALGLSLGADRAPNGELSIERMAPGDALSDLLAHAYCFDPGRLPEKEAMVRDYLALSARMPVFRVVLGRGLEGLDAGLASLAALVRRELDLAEP